MHPEHVVAKAKALRVLGVPTKRISDLLGIPRNTVREWLRSDCSRRWIEPHAPLLNAVRSALRN